MIRYYNPNVKNVDKMNRKTHVPDSSNFGFKHNPTLLENKINFDSLTADNWNNAVYDQQLKNGIETPLLEDKSNAKASQRGDR